MLNLVQIPITYVFDNKGNAVLSFWTIFMCNWYKSYYCTVECTKYNKYCTVECTKYNE